VLACLSWLALSIGGGWNDWSCLSWWFGISMLTLIGWCCLLLTDTPCCVIFHSQILLCVKVVPDELLGPGRWMEGGFVVVRGHHKNNSRRDSTHRWSGTVNFHHMLLQLSCWFSMLFFSYTLQQLCCLVVSWEGSLWYKYDEMADTKRMLHHIDTALGFKHDILCAPAGYTELR